MKDKRLLGGGSSFGWFGLVLSFASLPAFVCCAPSIRPLTKGKTSPLTQPPCSTSRVPGSEELGAGSVGGIALMPHNRTAGRGAQMAQVWAGAPTEFGPVGGRVGKMCRVELLEW